MENGTVIDILDKILSMVLASVAFYACYISIMFLSELLFDSYTQGFLFRIFFFSMIGYGLWSDDILRGR
jgi:hypothetical protein